ncbi:discoidin domain-containing protein [Bacillus fungorum]|uniref:discoidin domain-containing protein n=1 Tax=Bacillus fungorum TaxID=2039284 RepID=UPI003F554712
MKIKRILGLLALFIILTISPTYAVKEDTKTSSPKQPSDVSFSIPANSFCDRSHKVQVSINITGIKETSVTLKLFDQTGKPITTLNNEYNGIKSNIILGKSKAIQEGHTIFFQEIFGENNKSCDEIPYYGTISIDNETGGEILASGWISATNGNTPIIINSGLHFQVDKGEGTDFFESVTVPRLTCNEKNDLFEVSSSTSYSSEFLACKAFDKDVYTSWATKQGTTSGWLELESKKAIIIRNYDITFRTKSIDGVGTAPKIWTFEGSNDNQEWTVLDTQSEQTNWKFGEKRKFATDNKEEYRFYRLNIKSNNGVSYYTTIGELELY